MKSDWKEASSASFFAADAFGHSDNCTVPSCETWSVERPLSTCLDPALGVSSAGCIIVPCLVPSCETCKHALDAVLWALEALEVSEGQCAGQEVEEDLGILRRAMKLLGVQVEDPSPSDNPDPSSFCQPCGIGMSDNNSDDARYGVVILLERRKRELDDYIREGRLAGLDDDDLRDFTWSQMMMEKEYRESSRMMDEDPVFNPVLTQLQQQRGGTGGLDGTPTPSGAAMGPEVKCQLPQQQLPQQQRPPQPPGTSPDFLGSFIWTYSDPDFGQFGAPKQQQQQQQQQLQQQASAASKLAALHSKILRKEGRVDDAVAVETGQGRVAPDSPPNPSNNATGTKNPRSQRAALKPQKLRIRKRMIFKSHIVRFGESQDCPGCHAAIRELPPREHSDACRQRIEPLICADKADGTQSSQPNTGDATGSPCGDSANAAECKTDDNQEPSVETANIGCAAEIAVTTDSGCVDETRRITGKKRSAASYDADP